MVPLASWGGGNAADEEGATCEDAMDPADVAVVALEEPEDEEPAGPADVLGLGPLDKDTTPELPAPPGTHPAPVQVWPGAHPAAPSQRTRHTCSTHV